MAQLAHPTKSVHRKTVIDCSIAVVTVHCCASSRIRPSIGKPYRRRIVLTASMALQKPPTAWKGRHGRTRTTQPRYRCRAELKLVSRKCHNRTRSKRQLRTWQLHYVLGLVQSSLSKTSFDKPDRPSMARQGSVSSPRLWTLADVGFSVRPKNSLENEARQFFAG